MKQDEAYEKLMRRGLAGAAVLGLLIALIAATPADRARLSEAGAIAKVNERHICLLYTSPSPRDGLLSRMPSSA